MSSKLAAEAQSAIDTYSRLLVTTLPETCGGIYVVGSAALGDWHPDRSDIDVVAVLNRDMSERDLDGLAGLHEAIARRPFLDAVYLTREELGSMPGASRPGPDHSRQDHSRQDHSKADQSGADHSGAGGSGPGRKGPPYVVGGQFHRDGYDIDPVLWATLDRHGITVNGPAARDLGVAPDPAWLRDWNRGNLDSYWRPWAAAVRAKLSGRDPSSAIPADVLVWGALGPGRLHRTITTGDIISKTAAADYTASRFPEYADLLGRAKAWRLGDESLTFTAADGSAACDLVDAIVDSARA